MDPISKRPETRSGPGDPLEQIARDLLDGKDVDWPSLRRTHPGLRSRMEHLRLLQELTRSVWARRQAAGGVAVPMVGDPADRPQGRWGGLAILDRIGEGASSVVHRALDLGLGRIVALKLYHFQPEQRPRPMLGLLRDLETMAAIRHPNLLAVHGVGIQEGRPGMWADLIQGRTAEAMLASGGPLAPDRIASIGADLCRAMDALHFAGIVHGSVGTSKLAYESDGRAILMDATPPVPLEVTIRQFLAGRPVFLAPEILQGSVPGIASDVYSAGAVLYRLATGRNVIEPAPHEDLRSCIERWQVVPVAEARPGFPAGLADAIHSAIARHPSDRLTSARSLLVALPALSPA